MPGKPKPYAQKSEHTKERSREQRMERYYQRKLAGLCPQCGKVPHAQGKAWCDDCRNSNANRQRSYSVENHQKWNKTARVRLHEAVVAAYGGQCLCCGETHTPYLELDHRDGGGIAHRAKLKGQGNAFYQKLKNLGWPKENLQILCANCHRAKTRQLPCPPSHAGRMLIVDQDTRPWKSREHTDPARGGSAIVQPLPKLSKTALPAKQCLQCGKQILRDNPASVRRAKFCKNECKFEYQRVHKTKPPREMRDAVCVRCGNAFQYYPKNYAGKYCSSECRHRV